MTITRSDTEIIRDRLARHVKAGAAYAETHAKLYREVAARTVLDLRHRVETATDAEISRALFAIVAPAVVFGTGFYLPFGIL